VLLEILFSQLFATTRLRQFK